MIATRSGLECTGEKIAQEIVNCEMPIIFVDDAAIGIYITMVNKVVVCANGRVCANWYGG